jgi:hypothetical protein
LLSVGENLCWFPRYCQFYYLVGSILIVSHSKGG